MENQKRNFAIMFLLDDDIIEFPDVRLADDDGLLAIGGDLSLERLKLAYSLGIFPWYSEGEPILWYSPHKRFVLFPQEIKISKSMQQLIRQQHYSIQWNTDFEKIITHCRQQPRKGQAGTWITDEMTTAYIALHQAGIAKSVGVYFGSELVGGLYGVETGKIFCGESMFSLLPNTSKMALIYLCQQKKYSLIDCQIYTNHLASLGAKKIDRTSYNEYLQYKS